MVDFLITIFRSTYEELYIAAFAVAVLLLLSGIDDLFIDLYYWIHHFFDKRRFNKYQNLPPEKLHEVPEKPIAIFVPAWHEHEVIDKMLINACSTIQYKNYDIFVGVYPNDPQTIEKVEEVSRVYKNVHAVISQQEGPTTKADNLNQIFSGMLKYENVTGIRYEIIILHDAEDVIHPMSLKIHNFFIPEYDMVQVPVFPLETSHASIVHWTYSDEFSEHHTKDLITRQHFNGFVPSAGVGTAFNRWLLEFAGTSFARNIFRSGSLTEDYDLALRLALGRANLLFVYKPFGMDVATRGFFPQSMRAAIRQKSRWIMGICLQAWRTIGWKGDAKFRFVLYRDRKAIVSNVVNFIAYLVITYFLMYEAIRFGLEAYRELPPIVVKGTLLWYLVVIDTFLMLWRMTHRFITVNRIYGWRPAFLSILRQPIANIINMGATGRAIYQFIKAILLKRHLKWEKTAHQYPTTAKQAAR